MFGTWTLVAKFGTAVLSLAAVLGAAWLAISPGIELQRVRAHTAEQDLVQAEAQALVLEGQQREINRAADIDRA
jgi:hypothetical protein